ncbi:MAG: hypothetical protein WHV67_08135, partial [Thermoanaerobaculia bacterium]
MTFKFKLYPELEIVYDSRHSLFMTDETIALHKNTKTALLRTSDGYEIYYERDKNPGSENANGQRYIRISDFSDDYGDMWVKDSEIKVERRAGGMRCYIEDKRLKETGTEKYFVLQKIEGLTDKVQYLFNEEGKILEILPDQGPGIEFNYTGNLIEIGLYGKEPGYILEINEEENPLNLTLNMQIPSAHSSEPIQNTNYQLTYNFTYWPNGKLRKVEDNLGRKYIEAYYFSDGKVSTLTTQGGTYNYNYTSNETTITFTENQNLRQSPILLKVTYQGNIVTKIDPLGYFEIFTYNNLGDLIKYQDKNGNIYQYFYINHKRTKTIDPEGNIWEWTYNTQGQVIQAKDPKGAITQYFYDAANNLIKIINPIGAITEFTYEFSNIKTHKDPGGHITRYNYEYEVGPTPIGEERKITKKTTIDPEGYQTQEFYTYDELTGQRLTTKIIRPNGGIWEYAYGHSDGKVYQKEVKDPYNNIISGNYENAPCGGYYLVEYGYRRDGRCDWCPEANQHRFWYGKDAQTGLITRTRDQDGYETEYTYQNILDRWYLKEIKRYSKKNENWTNLYCGLKVPNWQRPSPEGEVQITRYEYNARGDLIKEIDPLGREVWYNYDGAGNMIEKRFPNGYSNTYTYDNLNRLVKIEYPNGTEDVFSYDSLGNLTYAMGQDSGIFYTYDLISRVVQAEQVYIDRSDIIEYQYDIENLRQMMKYGDKIWTYSYDANHRTRYITNPEGLVEEIKYAGCCNQIEEVVHSNGSKTVYQYDIAERITDVYNLKPDNSIIKSFNYQRDVNGFVTDVLREDQIWDQHYFYDNRLQLQGVIYGDGNTEIYSYDGRGNRLSIEENGQLREEYQYNIADEITQRQIHMDGVRTEYYNYEYQNDPDILMKFKMNYTRFDPFPPAWRTEHKEEQAFDYREKMANFYKETKTYRGGNLWLTSTLNSNFLYLPDGLGRVGKKAYSAFKVGEELPATGVRTAKDVFYLNDFYDLLYEKMDSVTSSGGNPPEYFQSEKYYTMGPGIDFPLVMNYRVEEQQGRTTEAYPPFTLHASRSTTNYFYFLNGHGDVTYFSDA